MVSVKYITPPVKPIWDEEINQICLTKLALNKVVGYTVIWETSLNLIKCGDVKKIPTMDRSWKKINAYTYDINEIAV